MQQYQNPILNGKVSSYIPNPYLSSPCCASLHLFTSRFKDGWWTEDEVAENQKYTNLDEDMSTNDMVGLRVDQW